ncbi:MAG: hypothetical protein ABSB09_05635 [Acidimicrobiales bacterium]
MQADVVVEGEPTRPPQPHDSGPAPTTERGGDVTRYAFVTTAALAVVTLPYLWILWDLWTGSAGPLRSVAPSNLYDLQGRAILAGHLYLPPGSIGIEAFVNGGHQYTYFGLFPSLIRLPVLALTHSLDGRLTAVSMLLAWSVTGLFGSLLLWRVRLTLRGSALLGRTEAIACGVLVAAVNGSVLFYIASSPQSSYEDLAWSVALTLGAVFALFGVAERPSGRRLALAGLFVVCAALDRSTTGYACILGTLVLALWLATGREGPEKKRAVVPLVAIALVSLLLSAIIAWSKLGSPFGLSLSDQVWTSVNAHRRAFLVANGGSAFGLQFLPSTLLAYFQPLGLSVSAHFPFLAIPRSPAHAVGGVVLDQVLPTASVPASMPLLFVLACWGTVATFRPRHLGDVRVLRILWLATAAATSGVLLYGATIAERYLADFIPFLALASMIGLVDLWARLGRRSPTVQATSAVVVVVLGVFGIWVNIGGAVLPAALWTPTQAQNFVSFQRSLGGTPPVERGASLPAFRPGGTLFATGDCSGLYISNGSDVSYIPGKALQHDSWTPVEQASGSTVVLDVTLTSPVTAGDPAMTMATYGPASLELVPTGPNMVEMVLDHTGISASVWPPDDTPSAAMHPGTPYQIVIESDSNLTSMTASGLGLGIQHYVPGNGPLVVRSSAGSTGSPLAVSTVHRSRSSMPLCRALIGGT